MSKIAIDVVLLPPKSVMAFALQKNKALLTGMNDITVLDEETCVPHISLCMGAIETSKLKQVQKALKKAVDSLQPLNLKCILTHQRRKLK